MNDLIRSFADRTRVVQYGIDTNSDTYPTNLDNLEAFAWLIVYACLEECDKQDPKPDEYSDQHEYADRRVARACMGAIKAKFNL